MIILQVVEMSINLINEKIEQELARRDGCNLSDICDITFLVN